MNSLKQLFVILLLLVGSIAFGQGMTLHGGTSSMKSEFLALTPDETAHSGYHLGADGRLGDDGFYFLVGLQYHKLSLSPTEKFSLMPTDPSMNFIKGKGGFAFKIFQINKDIVARLRVLGTIDYLLNGHSLNQDLDLDSKQFNEAVAGAGGGLEIDVYFMTLNLEYQKGFFNALNETPDSSLDFLTFSLGVNF